MIEERIKQIFQMEKRWFNETKVGSFNLTYSSNALPYVVFSDDLFPDFAWQLGINEGVWTDYDDVADQVIKGYHQLLAQREKMISFGFESVGLSNTLFCFKCQTPGHEYFACRKREVSEHGAFIRNVIEIKEFKEDKSSTPQVQQTNDMIKAILKFFENKVPQNERMLLNSKLRDELILKNEH